MKPNMAATLKVKNKVGTTHIQHCFVTFLTKIGIVKFWTLYSQSGEFVKVFVSSE